ncbi:hypothetical protein GALMADRAFT_135315 [Galerina marginata CBS 339.88]|uniref:F-box domain-containing protein n=1 Tax=Galerina marginata (strain CBS 339.88) TaxID=685588 RepID=A0A067TFE8_GALM3|nr:hypothetical protein GALMADRAFT_135315 [Galerina marginata CBS 339.88]
MSLGALFNELPAEIRLGIFRLATMKKSQHEDTSLDYRPFEAVPLRDRDWSKSAQRALDVKMTIVLVCKEWKKIATEMLYECIRIEHGTDHLLSALEGHADAPLDNGKWVRRIEISPVIADFDPFNPLPLLRIMERCPLVETIVRPCISESGGATLGNVRLPPGTEFPTFTSVKRIEWWIPGVTPTVNGLLIAPFQWRPFSGFLGEIVAHSPNLQYLTLSGGWRFFDTSNPIEPFTRPTYNNLTTLRLEGEHEGVLFDNLTVSLPNLRYFILGVLYASAGFLLKKHGQLIRVLELVDLAPPLPSEVHKTILKSSYNTKDVLAACPNLEDFCAPLRIGTSLRTENTTVILKSLTCIRIKLDDSSPLTSPDFGYFIRDKLACPALERIVLHGSPKAWKENSCYKVLEEVVSQMKYGVLVFA